MHTERPATGGQPLPEGTVTILSTDLVGSTLLNQRLGDEAATAIERDIERSALEQVAKHRGAVVKDTGDGLMAAFQSARRAVACAQEIQRALERRNRQAADVPVSLRIGLHTGEVLADSGTLHGETLIVAKRVEEVAPPGGIFASDTVYGVLGTARSELQDRGAFTLKGIELPWQLYEVPWAEDGAAELLAPSERTPFVGRAGERARLRELVERAAAGSGAMVLLVGDAGVGKTRLAEETAAVAASSGMGTLVGHCLDMEGAQPFLPLIEQIEQAARNVSPEALREMLGENAPEVAKLMPELRQRYPDIPDPPNLPPEGERRYVLHGVSEFIERAARAQPLVLMFEDLHWADESTLFLLRQLAARLREMPVLLIGTYRPRELGPGRPFGSVLEDLLRERLVEEVVLEQLSEDGVSAMLEGRAGKRPPPELVELVYSETEGNPFFVEEMFCHLNEAGKLFDEEGGWRSGIQIADTEVPRGVRLVIGHRLERVSEECRRILTTCAVVGRQFSFDLLCHVARVDEDTLLEAFEEAEEATLVQDASIDREARYIFKHEQIRQTLLSALSVPRRQRLHLRIANALEEHFAADVKLRPSEIAYHLYQAGGSADDERTARYLLLAGQRAMEALGYEDALRQFEATFSVLPEGDAEGRARVLCQRALALRGAARIDDALATYAEAIELAPAGAVRDDFIYERAKLKLDMFRGREAIADLETLLDHARERGDRAREADVVQALARAHWVLSLDDPAYTANVRESYEQAYALAREVGDRRAMARALIPTAQFTDYWRDYFDTAKKNIEEATAIAKELEDEDLAIDAAMMQLRLVIGQEAAVMAEELLARLEARRDPLRLKEHYFWLMWHYLGRAELERCVATCDAGIALAEQLGSPPVQYPTIKALALMNLGRFDEASSALEHEVADDDHRFGRAFQQHGVAIWLGRLGMLERAADVAIHALSELEHLNRPNFQRNMIDLLATISARAGEDQVDLRARARAAVEGALLEPGSLAAAEVWIADGRAEKAVERLAKTGAGAERAGLRGVVLQVRELEIRALAALERWDDVLERADEILAATEETGFRTLDWRVRSARGRARLATGDSEGAQRDLAAARETLLAVAATVPDPEVRAAFENDPPVRAVLRE